ncbi:MAG: hypothetical protein J0L64_09865 [Acidobacteria bacterium]|nr:hypothetical protein [Acidobacteriota bacterium]
MSKSLVDFRRYLDHGNFRANYRPWIIRHLALARNHESTLDAMVAAYRDRSSAKRPLATRFLNEALPRLLDHGIVLTNSPGVFRLNADLSPAEITELVSYCDRWLQQHAGSGPAKQG